MDNIIVVEDNESIRESVKSYLELEGYKVYDFDKSAGVMQALQHKEISLIILDVMLPDENGFKLAKKIKADYEIPIIFLSARVTESDRITGFELGADDYITKPFSPKELVLRVKALLKRVSGKPGGQNVDCRCMNGKNKLFIDNKSHKVYLNEQEIYLTSSEWQILSYLIRNHHQVLSREQILGECLDYISEGSERTVDTHIKNVRAKIGNEWIETLRGYGYKFVGEIH